MIQRHQFLDYIDRFRSARVLVIGPSVAEIDVHCAVTRLAPDRAMPLYQRLHQTWHPGGAALSASTMSNLGVEVVLLTAIGSDPSGQQLRSLLSEQNVVLCEIGDERAQTPELYRHLALGRQLLQIRRGWKQVHFTGVVPALEQQIDEGQMAGRPLACIMVVDNEPASLDQASIDAIGNIARAAGIPLIFDAAGADHVPPRGGLTSHLIVNERESLHISRRILYGSALLNNSSGANMLDDQIERLRYLCTNISRHTLLTLGRQGAVIGSIEAPSCRSGSEAQAPASEVQPIIPHVHALADRRGVGFVLSAVYAALIAVNARPEDAAYLACQAASLASANPGPKRLEIEALLRIGYSEIDLHAADGIEVFSRIRATHLPVIDRAARLLMEAYNEGRQVLVCGNGGSAAEANHLVGELTGRFKESRPGLPAISLSANDSLTTCLGNDYGFEDVFARQVETFCRPGDVVIGMSTSGRSINVLKAMQTARTRGARIIAFTGEEVGPMGEVADVTISVPSRSTARIQEAHLFVIHVMCDMLDKRLDSQGRLHPSASEM